MNECKDCKHWGITDTYNEQLDDYVPIATDENTHGARPCYKMKSCLCCNYQTQIAGPIGGGEFRSMPNFGCILWESK